MKTIIAGSRDIEDIAELYAAIEECGWTPSIVVSGTARGVDRLGELWAENKGIPIERHPADWNTHGKRAGRIRNAQMALSAEALIALWDGKSKGTQHMIEVAKLHGLRVFVRIVEV